MKKTLVFIVMCVAALTTYSQSAEGIGKTTYEQCTKFYKTPPLRDLIKSIDFSTVNEKPEENTPRPIKTSRYGDTTLIDHSVDKKDGALQSSQGTNNEKGLRLQLNIDGLYSAGIPPDPTGAAGIDHYLQAVNSTYRIYLKNGDPETPPFPLDNFWDKSGNGDPIVMYDRFAERYFISQFYRDEDAGEYGLLIAISASSDPLGEYYSYQYDFALFPDYPKYSVWSSAYFMSANSSSSDCCAFERQKMLLGDPTAGVIKMTFPPVYLQFNSITPSYAEGPLEPEIDEPCYFFAVQDNSYPGVSADHIKIFRADIDWDSPGTSSVTEHQQLNTASFNSIFGGSWTENLIQKGTSQRLDAIPGVFMYRAQYRRFESYNTLVLCHNVNVGGSRAGMRWYELRDNNDGDWSIHQQGTYAPSDGKNRWMGNLAMDAAGNIAMAYSYNGTDDYPGLRYTGRFKDDPLGEMTVPEQIAVEGEGTQTGIGRYGDYSQMSMDPTDDRTFWFTGEFLGFGGDLKTRIFSFSTWHLLGVDEEENIPQFNAFQPNSSQLKLEWSDVIDENIIITVFDLGGKQILSRELKSHSNGQLIHLPEIVNGVFIVKLTGSQTNLTTKIYIGK